MIVARGTETEIEIVIEITEAVETLVEETLAEIE